MRRLRIGFLLPRYSRHSASQMPLVMRALAEAGVVVDVVRPTERIVELSRLEAEQDLYVLKKISGLALSLAGALHSRGAAIVNPYPVTVALYDKIIACRILQAAGVPTPATYVVSHPEELAPLLDAGPVVVKPYQGTGGEGVRVVRSAAALADVSHDKKDPVLAQRYHEPEGRDRKIYRIGDRFFGVKKVFPARTEAEKYGEPFTPTPELCDIVQRCGQAFGIDLYGIDIIESEGQPYVVDMSSIPGFKGVPDATLHLAKYYYSMAENAARGRPVCEPALPIEAARAAEAS
jgi:ribosomal protein S6--L-glutamate ligase